MTVDNNETHLVPVSTPEASLAAVGQVANTIAGRNVFERYRKRKSANTKERQQYDLRLFAQYLAAVGLDISGEHFYENPEAWHGITWGLIEGFVEWQLQEGFAVASVNSRLSTIKTYARLAAVTSRAK